MELPVRDNPIHTFFQLLTGEIGDQMALSPGLRGYTVLLYWALLIGGIAIAAISLRRDPTQRSGTNVSIFALRFIMAGLWYLGSLWKLPWPVSGGFKFWLESTVKFSSFQWHADVMQVFLDHIAFVQPLVYLLEVFFTMSLMFGFMVRVSSLIAALFTFNLLIGLYNDPTEWPWTYVGIIFTELLFVFTRAGRCLGADSLIAPHLVRLPLLRGPVTARAVRWVFSAA